MASKRMFSKMIQPLNYKTGVFFQQKASDAKNELAKPEDSAEQKLSDTFLPRKQAKSTPLFAGRAGSEQMENLHPDMANRTLRTETAFFRDAETLETLVTLIKDLKQKRPTLRIAAYACSSGQECYSLAMLLDDLNQDNKIKITGYDIAREALDDAKEGKFTINYNPSKYKVKIAVGAQAQADAYLAFPKIPQFPNSSIIPSVERQNKYHQLFKRFFSQEEETQQSDESQSKTFKIKPAFASKCDFKEGDITKINQELGQQSTDIIFFRNALYHLITNNEKNSERRSKSEQESQTILSNLFRNIHQALKPDGLLVMGNKEAGQHMQPDRVHQTLRQVGFQPVYEQNGIPTIWKKIELTP